MLKGVGLTEDVPRFDKEGKKKCRQIKNTSQVSQIERVN